MNENEDKINGDKLIKKRNFNEMIHSIVNLKEINLENEKTIKLFYEFYTNKFNLDEIKIYEDTKKFCSFDELENFSNSLYCFVMAKNIKDDAYYLIYYNNINLKSYIFIENDFVEEKKVYEEHNKQNNYRFFFLGEKEEIENNICLIKGAINNIFSKLEKK